MARIFISYSRDDRPFLDNFVPLVRRVYGNDSLWFDDDIHGGANWWDMILTEIGNCDVFIYLISNESLKSPYCQAEFREALRLNKKFLPVIVRRLKPPYPGEAPRDLADDLRRTQYIDFSGGFKNPDAISSFYAALNRLLLATPSQPEPQTHTPTPQPPVPDKKSWWQDITEGQGMVVAAVIGLVGVIAAALIAASASQQETPTPTPTQQTTVAALVQTDVPTSTATTEPSLTFTPTPSFTATTDETVQASINLTATAAAWTNTPQPTETFTSVPPSAISTLTPTTPSTLSPLELARTRVTRNADWTPYPETFNGVRMVLVPAGCFMMGSTSEQVDYVVDVLGAERSWLDAEQPANEVCFDEPFWIDETEVTNAQFRQFGGVAARASNWTGDNRPREQITWFEARDFCAKRGARLPTEAEWEYAARGPDNLVYPWGNDFIADRMVYGINSDNQTENVGSKLEGQSWVGALDMSGNVLEWTVNLYSAYPYSTSGGNEDSEDYNNSRVLRGGAWAVINPADLRSANREWNYPAVGYGNIGFRCVRSVDAATTSNSIPEPTSISERLSTPSPLEIAHTPITQNSDWTPIEQDFDGVMMVLVPVGCLNMGHDGGGYLITPVNNYCFNEPFWIDKYEVTNIQFSRLGGVASDRSFWTNNNQPRQRVTWFEVRNFCEKRGMRLPTEAEWEYAAHGPDNLIYPWGNDFISDNVVYDGNSNQPLNVGSKLKAQV